MRPVWKIWSWRNEVRHGTTILDLSIRERIISNLVRKVDQAFNSSNSHQLGRRTVVVNIAWQFSEAGCVKINTDGAARGNLAFKAELWGILCGLELAWSEGFCYIEIESDSKSAIYVLTKDGIAVREGHLITWIQTWL
ncbi:uncharacterized protein LOC133295841 [Gastrolobium bilobum]|uniref:uncharacterized protein LOC133295841 n=1 Tax=Gastrolobium bilobum TaxID=150636 RepID=UPI002AB3070E|nr:uncharacterized protein LOC133295841 [Gastrolobium bilobum]